MRKSLWVILTVLLGAGAGIVRADSITLDVSASLSPINGASCSASGCTLSGSLVVDSTTGALVSADVKMSGETPLVSPFTVPMGTLFDAALPGGFNIMICNPDFCLGGDLSPSAEKILQNALQNNPNSFENIASNILFEIQTTEAGETGNVKEEWVSTIGTLTSPTVTPEPSSLCLILAGIGLVLVMRKRTGQNLPWVS